MFKIGNSKELPPIPDNLSGDGKDFIRQCLQREPLNRPTAAELLNHPFLRNVAGDQISADKGSTNARNIASLDMEHLAIQRLQIATAVGTYSDYRLRNVSCPVSPIRSPLLYTSPKRMNGRNSPPLIPSPKTISGSSTPLNGGYGAVSSKQFMQSYIHGGFRDKMKSSRNIHVTGSSYVDRKHAQGPATQAGSPAFGEYKNI